MKKARMIVNIAMTVVLLCLMASLKHYKKIIEDMELYYDDSCKTSFED